MRTVTFSEPRLQKFLNNNFVNTFSSTEGDATSGQSIKHSPNDPSGNCIRGNGKQNVQTIFMNPDGEIFHVATGFLDAEALYAEAEFALRLFDEMQQADDSDVGKVVAVAHKDRLRELGFAEKEIESQTEFARIKDMMNNRSGSSGFGAPAHRMSGTGSSSRNGDPQLGTANHMFQRFVKRQILEDNQFSIKYPLMSQTEFERDPTKLVGNSKTFFSSSSSGN